jgi:hypothetical protein
MNCETIVCEMNSPINGDYYARVLERSVGDSQGLGRYTQHDRRRDHLHVKKISQGIRNIGDGAEEMDEDDGPSLLDPKKAFAKRTSPV